MIHVIINGNLVDRDYVENHTVGFDQLKERAAGFAPEYAERVPGVPAADIRLLAHKYATTRHAERLRRSKLSPEGLSPGSLREARTLGGNGGKQPSKQMSRASGPVVVLHQFAPRPSPLNGVALS